LTDLDGNERYIQVNVKATKFDDIKTAKEAMEEEMESYTDQLAREQAAAEKKEKKIAEAKAKKEREKDKEEG
jgi:hypothetical protein